MEREPLVARVAPDDHEPVHHLACASRWKPTPLEGVLGAGAGDGIRATFRHVPTWMVGIPRVQTLHQPDATRTCARSRLSPDWHPEVTREGLPWP